MSRQGTTFGAFVASAAALVLLIGWERRRADPLIELRVFRSVSFTGALVIAVCAFACLGGFLFLTTLYLQDVRGLTVWQAGLQLIPLAAATAVAVCRVRGGDEVPGLPDPGRAPSPPHDGAQCPPSWANSVPASSAWSVALVIALFAAVPLPARRSVTAVS